MPLDSNGIWQYSETDPLSPFSDLLNMGQVSVSDAIEDVNTRVSAIKPWPASLNQRAAQWRRGAQDSFGSGSFINIGGTSLPAAAPSGLYSVTFAPVLASSATGTAAIRGTVNGANLTADDAYTLSTLPQTVSIPTLYTHAGGALTVTLEVRTYAPSTTVYASSRITVAWLGPA
jgi:hypothetical protein